MKDFSELLKKIYASLNKDTLEKENVLLELKNCTGAKLDSSSVFIRDGVLEISASPTLKNEIKLKEERLLTALKNNHKLSYTRILYK
ncbi:MAG: hypothetical protein M3Q24_01020 [bacterium]|nr:hypothetical protein [bacterium]